MFALLAVLFTGSVAEAQCQCGGVPTCPAIQVLYSNLACSSYSCFQDADGGYRIIFNSALVCNPTSAVINIRPAASGVVLKSVTINSQTNAPSNTNININILSSTTGWFERVGSITSTGNIAVYAGEIQVPLGSIDGNWTLHSINNVEASGDISANFVSTGSTGTGAAGDIALVKSTNGKIIGNFTANGKIDEINAADSVGASGSLISINCKNELRRLFGSSVYANINTRNSGGSGDFWYMKTTSGPFVGSLTTTDIEAPVGISLRGLDIGGNLGAVITCSGQIKEAISIDGAVLTGGHINTTANGITKQIIINQDNSTYLWLDSATVGSTTLTQVP